jgi:hypothetical protein
LIINDIDINDAMIQNFIKIKNLFPLTTSKNTWMAFAILLIGVLCTISATIYTKREVERQLNNDYRIICNEIKTKIVAPCKSIKWGFKGVLI